MFGTRRKMTAVQRPGSCRLAFWLPEHSADLMFATIPREAASHQPGLSHRHVATGASPDMLGPPCSAVYLGRPRIPKPPGARVPAPSRQSAVHFGRRFQAPLPCRDTPQQRRERPGAPGGCRGDPAAAEGRGRAGTMHGPPRGAPGWQ